MAHAPKHKFQMTLIAPEKGMSEIFSKIAKKMRVNLQVVKGGELNAIETVQNLSPDSCDVILARRIVARHLHQHTAIPVISVELSTLDLLRILQLCGPCSQNNPLPYRFASLRSELCRPRAPHGDSPMHIHHP